MSKMLFWKPEYVNMLFCLKYVKKYAFMLSHFFPVSTDYNYGTSCTLYCNKNNLAGCTYTILVALTFE